MTSNRLNRLYPHYLYSRVRWPVPRRVWIPTGFQTRRVTGHVTRALTCTICMYILYRSWGWMCTTSETCRANSAIKTALNNLHQAGPNKTHIWWCMEKLKSNLIYLLGTYVLTTSLLSNVFRMYRKACFQSSSFWNVTQSSLIAVYQDCLISC